MTPAVSAYASWLDRRRWWILAGSIVVAGIAAWVALQLPVYSDIARLLPQDARSVRDLHAIEQRARVVGTLMVAVKSDDPVARSRTAKVLRDQLQAFEPALVSSVIYDRGTERRYGWAHRWLFVDLADLENDRRALADRIDQAKLAANPLFVELDEPAPATDDAAALRDRLRDAEATKDEPGELVSSDHRLQLVIIHTAFSSGDQAKARALLAAVSGLIERVQAGAPGVEIGVAGDIAVSVAEHDAILSGMARATIVTLVLVLLGLGWFFRSALAIGALSWSLVVGTVATLAFTRLTIGHLNLATAFLSSIVIGNGINTGIVLTARYREQLRSGRDGADALAAAIEHTLRGTFTAALTAAVAYASLTITVFRGFRDFGIIGSVGLLLCWISAYTVLPAGLAGARRLGMGPGREPPIGRWLARALPARFRTVAIAGIGLVVVAAGIAVHYLATDPFESNFKNLRSRSSTITEERRWMHEIDAGFGQGIDAGFVIAVPRRQDVAPLVARLRAVDVGSAPADKLFGSLTTLDDLVPKDQPRKLEVLADIRQRMSSTAFQDLPDTDRAELAKLRPPEDLRILGDHDVPDQLAWPFVEADGSRGRLILATAGPGFEVWDAHDTVRFADRIGALGLPADVHLGGASFVFSDVLAAVLGDGPRATLASLAGAIVIVVLVLGPRRHAWITIACGLSGTILMLALAAVLGLRVNFLDFVALPITIGIGIEYSVNIVTRERQDGPRRIREAIATTGAAVLLCSYTTIVGYGSLLMSQNLGIRSFGIAAMLGEVTCIVAALVLAPALLSITAPRDRGGAAPPTASA